MADRRSFEEKYKNIHEEWNIKQNLTNYIIRRYSKKLVEELDSLKKDKIKLPRYYRDRRTDEEYVYDLIDGWLIEDIICDAWLRDRLLEVNNKIDIKHMGTNRDRKVIKKEKSKITTFPDFIYKVSGEEVKIEMQMARTERIEGYDMKESKVKRAKENGNIFLWIIIPTNKYFICEPEEDLKDIKPFSNPLWGGKKVYRLSKKKLEEIGEYDMKKSINKKNWRKLKLI